MSKYTITAPNGEKITVKAETHIQNIWNKSKLIGVTQSGAKRLEKFLAENCEWSNLGFYANTTVDATQYHPLLEGFDVYKK